RRTLHSFPTRRSSDLAGDAVQHHRIADPGARVLDGYAGTGALGIEAISRGAGHVTFVERDRRAQALVAANVAHCGIADGYVIIRDRKSTRLTPVTVRS